MVISKSEMLLKDHCHLRTPANSSHRPSVDPKHRLCVSKSSILPVSLRWVFACSATSNLQFHNSSRLACLSMRIANRQNAGPWPPSPTCSCHASRHSSRPHLPSRQPSLRRYAWTSSCSMVLSTESAVEPPKSSSSFSPSPGTKGCGSRRMAWSPSRSVRVEPNAQSDPIRRSSQRMVTFLSELPKNKMPKTPRRPVMSGLLCLLRHLRMPPSITSRIFVSSSRAGRSLRCWSTRSTSSKGVGHCRCAAIVDV